MTDVDAEYKRHLNELELYNFQDKTHKDQNEYFSVYQESASKVAGELNMLNSSKVASPELFMRLLTDRIPVDYVMDSLIDIITENLHIALIHKPTKLSHSQFDLIEGGVGYTYLRLMEAFNDALQKCMSQVQCIRQYHPGSA